MLTKADFLLIGTDPTPRPPDSPTWLSYPAVANHVSERTLYADIVNHYKETLNYNTRLVTAHETTHMINADIRNQHGDGIKICGFYVGDNCACIMDQPRMRKSDVIPFVPGKLRGDRYKVYVEGQTEWDDSPLNLYDEWTAYNNGARTVVQMVQMGTYNEGWTDGVCGPLEFAVFTLALMLAVEKHDPDYMKRTPDFLKYTNWNLHTGYEVYKAGSVMEQFKWDRQDQMLDSLRNDSESSELRRIAKQYFNDVWIS